MKVILNRVILVYKYEMLLRNQEDKEKTRSMGLRNVEKAGYLVKNNSSGMEGRDAQGEYVKKVI